jgi:hypothetical protein
MDNEKRKAEHHFNDQAIKEAVKRMTPELWKLPAKRLTK